MTRRESYYRQKHAELHPCEFSVYVELLQRCLFEYGTIGSVSTETLKNWHENRGVEDFQVSDGASEFVRDLVAHTMKVENFEISHKQRPDDVSKVVRDLLAHAMENGIPIHATDQNRRLMLLPFGCVEYPDICFAAPSVGLERVCNIVVPLNPISALYYLDRSIQDRLDNEEALCKYFNELRRRFERDQRSDRHKEDGYKLGAIAELVYGLSLSSAMRPYLWLL